MEERINDCCCARQLQGEPRPVPAGFCMDGCQQNAWVCDDNVLIQGEGRIVVVHVRLRQVCPGHEIALAVSLTETDACGRQEHRGMKVLRLPPMPGTRCRDLIVRDLRFVLPEECLHCCRTTRCCPRCLQVRTLANYLDTGMPCCSQ